MQQILISEQFCDEIKQECIQENDVKINLISGHSYSGIILVPQELPGICVVSTGDFNEMIMLHKLDKVRKISGECTFAIVQPDRGIRLGAVEYMYDTLEGIKGVVTDDTLHEIGRDLLKDSDSEWRVSSRIKKLQSMIYENRGHASLPELADRAGCTVRTVHRIFIQELGKSPKEYERILRIRKTVERMLENPKESITNYMEGMGYSDQAHFQREFKWYTGFTPGKFLRYLRSESVD